MSLFLTRLCVVASRWCLACSQTSPTLVILESFLPRSAFDDSLFGPRREGKDAGSRYCRGAPPSSQNQLPPAFFSSLPTLSPLSDRGAYTKSLGIATNPRPRQVGIQPHRGAGADVLMRDTPSLHSSASNASTRDARYPPCSNPSMTSLVSKFDRSLGGMLTRRTSKSSFLPDAPSLSRLRSRLSLPRTVLSPAHPAALNLPLTMAQVTHARLPLYYLAHTLLPLLIFFSCHTISLAEELKVLVRPRAC
jgi:hypothetical protein